MLATDGSFALLGIRHASWNNTSFVTFTSAIVLDIPVFASTVADFRRNFVVIQSSVENGLGEYRNEKSCACVYVRSC
jgi:hypothetical protein